MIITHNQKYIWACPLEVSNFLSQKLNDVIQQNNVTLSENLREFIEELSKVGYKIHIVDFADYTNNKQDLIVFTILMQQSIDVLNKENSHFFIINKIYYEKLYQCLQDACITFPYYTPEEVKLSGWDLYKGRIDKKNAIITPEKL